ncbi:MAG: peptidase M14 [Kordiimonadales bacterium]|nr:MAG: peptidase M14 [Kordiimonadales bacterium]
MRTRIQGLAVFLAIFASFSATAQENFVFWPDADYDTAIPTLESVVGHRSGDEITSHADMVRYFEALAAAAPDRIALFNYGESWEGRNLIYVAISNPKNISALGSFKAGMQALSDPRKTNKAAADKLVSDMPASTWLAYGVHGNEISSTDAAIQTAYHLLASKGDARVPSIMENSITFLAPMQNPDGRTRFINRFETARGMVADSDPLSAEHNEPWPSGRTNHYLFDMNRDWIVLTQPETQGHVKALQEWYPLVFVDLHEMGGNSSYYFAPEAIPYNPHLAQDQRDSLTLFGKNNAKWFDKFGYEYFTRDVFDAFYPGYGASWPAYYGGVAMTYEQASSRGLVYRRYDGKELAYRQTVKQHFITSLATAEVTASNREKLLKNFYDYQVSAIEEGRKDKQKRSYIFPASRDRAANRKLASLLVEQGIEVSQASGNFKACGTNYSAGAFIVDAAQPRKRMIHTLLDPQVDMNADWVAEQERRRAKNIGHDIYDVTAWSLPIMFNVDMAVCGKAVSTQMTAVTAGRILPGTVSNPAATVAYIAPGGDMASGRLLTAALRKGMQVKLVDKPFTHNGRAYTSGSLIFDVADNAKNLGATLQTMAAHSGAEIIGIDDSWVDSGSDFGGRAVNEILPPKVAIVWDEPTSQLAAGNTRFVIERQFGYPVTAIRARHLSRANLARYQVLILPSSRGSYQATFGKAGAENLTDWVSKGGVLIGTGTALRYLTGDKVALLKLDREALAREKEAKETKKKKGRIPGTLLKSADEMRALTQPANENPDSVPGVLAKVSLDADHWLSAGLPTQLNVLIRGSDIYAPMNLENGTNVAWFEGSDALLASGHLWEENRKQYAFKPFVVVQPKGRGMVIGFTQDPTVRAYLDGLNQIFFNAIFHGAAHARPIR